MPDVPEIEDQGTKPATMCQLPSSSPTGPSAPRERESRQCGVGHRWTGMARGQFLGGELLPSSGPVSQR